jgi:hypothetical protein
LVRTISALLALAVTLSASTSGANPETGDWINSLSGSAVLQLGFNQTAVFTIVGTTDSRAIAVEAPTADICFDPDTGGVAGSARVSIYRAVNPATVTLNGSILLPPVPTDNSDCLEAVRGVYWAEVTTGPTGGEVAVVSITTRSN